MSTITLRNYQISLISAINGAWGDGARNVIAQLPTGGGKTVVLSSIIKQLNAPTIAIAHRAELVSQLSLTLALNKIRHDILAPQHVARTIVQLHMYHCGASYYHPGAKTMCASVDTLTRMQDPRFNRVELAVVDEGHHVLRENKWGSALDLFPNARGLFPTATPTRADGKGLGRHADGLADVIVTGPSMRDLINAGYLSDYLIVAPSSDLDLSHVPLSASGDFSPPKLREAVRKSRIVGDVVENYLKFAKGKLGLTFASDIECATEIAESYRAAGVPAEVITGKTPPLLRAHLLDRFKRREILELVNVDLLGEGVDIPAIEVVSFARPTESFSLYCQQFGRALRILDGKDKALIIDHVGNVMRHGLPDSPRSWSLNRRDRKTKTAPGDVIPVRSCGNDRCLAVYERVYKACPYCGYVTPVAVRSSPEQVDGDLILLDAATLAAMRGEVARIDDDPRVPQHLDAYAQKAVIKRHLTRQHAQSELRKAIALWAGYQRELKRDDSEIYRRFYFMYGVDVLSAQSLNTADAHELQEKIKTQLAAAGVVEASTLED